MGPLKAVVGPAMDIVEGRVIVRLSERRVRLAWFSTPPFPASATAAATPAASAALNDAALFAAPLRPTPVPVAAEELPPANTVIFPESWPAPALPVAA